jgi:hypothetical protein
MSCKFHSWRLRADCHEHGSMPLPEARRQLSVFPPVLCRASRGGTGVREAGVLRLSASVAQQQASKRRRVQESGGRPDGGGGGSGVCGGGRGSSFTPRQRMARFLRLLEHMETAWMAPQSFSVNSKILMQLTAAHAHLIAPGGDPTEMLHMIDPNNSLVGAKNLVWITNRQQGKTTTLGKFIAAMAIACPTGGVLACVYSTNQDRAQELTKMAKEYVFWMNTPAGRSPDFPVLKFVKNNNTTFMLFNGEATNEVRARPKNTNSCRGDNPAFCVVDEVAFVTADFWWKFIYPLLQVGTRQVTCATTPPPSDGFFQKFIEEIIKQNKSGNYFFRLVNHSLACASCLENQDAGRCCHNLHLIPPWKSLVRLNRMKALVPASKHKDYETEVYGVLSEAAPKYLPAPLLDAAVDSERYTFDPNREPFSTVYVSVDPASHGKSDMGMVALGLTPSGDHVILGLVSVNMSRCQTTEVQAVVRSFLRQLRQSPLLDEHTLIVPIIECNNNEILAMSILSVFHTLGPVWMPFTKSRFDAYITHGVGIWTTEENKMAAIQCLYQKLLEGGVMFAHPLITSDMSVVHLRARKVGSDEMIKVMCDQLKSFRDQLDGKVSGKGADGEKDDLGMACLMVFYWSLCVRHYEQQQSVSLI